MEEEQERSEVITTIWRTFPPVLILIGSFGNILTIIVLAKRKNRQSPTVLYLISVAICDLVALWSGLLRQWIYYTFDYDIRNSSNAACKIHAFIVYFSLQCSSWFLIALTVERCICVMAPHRVKYLCRFQVSLTSCLVIAVLLFLVNMHFFWTLGLVDEGYCGSYDEQTYDSILIMDLFMFTLIPFVCLFIGNAYIIIRVLLHQRKIRRSISPSAITTVTGMRTTSSNGTEVRASARKEKSAKFSQMTLTLITLTVFFFVCSLPIGVLLVARKDWQDDAIWAVTNLLMYLNNTLNFVLYFLCGSRFANDVKQMFCGTRV